MNLIGVAEETRSQFKSAQLRNLYRRDFQAWKADVLGLRTYGKMQEIMDTALNKKKNRTAIKSANGTSKSFEVSAAISWVGSVHEPGETLSIITAPSLDQVSRVIFGYMRSFRTMASRRGYELPGWLNEREEWKFAGPSGNLNLAFGKKPAAGQEVSVFQGTRSEFGRTYVWIEEAGGVSKGLYTAAEAVLTGKHARGIYIGNPDNAESEFRGLFEDRKFDDEVNRFTISAYDLPTLTGEIVYPDDPDMQQRMMDSLTQPGWVEHKKRIWGENDARYLSKVLGEFPPDSGFGFFSTEDINTAMDTEIPDDGAVPCIFGVDIARFGTDECVIYVNRGGRVRLLDSWGKTDLYESAQRIFEHAQRLQPTEIRVDATGMGAGVKDFLFRDPQFAGEWDVIAIDGADSAPDKKKFHNMRAYIHDSAKQQMQEGLIDLDLIDDEDLKEQLTLITYKFNARGAVQISLKSDMQTEMGGSPDRADSFIYSVCDMTPWTGNPLNQFTPGERLVKEAHEIIKAEPPIQWYGRPGDAF